MKNAKENIEKEIKFQSEQELACVNEDDFKGCAYHSAKINAFMVALEYVNEAIAKAAADDDGLRIPTPEESLELRLGESELNEKEVEVLIACAKNSEDVAGGDFGITNEVKDYLKGYKPAEVAGYLGQLTQKGFLLIFPEFDQFDLTKKCLAYITPETTGLEKDVLEYMCEN